MTHCLFSLALATVVATGVAASVHASSEPTSVEAVAAEAEGHTSEAAGVQVEPTEEPNFTLRIDKFFKQQGALTRTIHDLRTKAKDVGRTSYSDAYAFNARINTLQGRIDALPTPAVQVSGDGFSVDEANVALVTQLEADIEQIDTDFKKLNEQIDTYIKKLDEQIEKQQASCCSSLSSCCSRRSKHKAE